VETQNLAPQASYSNAISCRVESNVEHLEEVKYREYSWAGKKIRVLILVVYIFPGLQKHEILPGMESTTPSNDRRVEIILNL
jgi:hypothetical protein